MKKDIVYSKIKYVKGSPRKARLVMNMIRGKNALEAATFVDFTQKGAARLIGKALKSAIANCTNNKGWDKNELVVEEARVDEAPTFKRGRAVSRGRNFKILKRNSHLIIGLSLYNK